MNGFRKYMTKIHINAIICSLALTYLSTLLILHGDRCAGASIAASIGTLAVAFAQQGNDDHKPEPSGDQVRAVVEQID